MTTTPEDLLAALAYDENSPFPRTPLEEIVRRKDEMIPRLLEILADCRDHPAEFLLDENSFLPIYAAYLLAQFRERRAFPLLIALLHFPDGVPRELWGDTMTEGMGNLLASVYDGNEQLLRDLFENPAADEHVRGAAVLDAYLTLLATDRITLAELEEYFSGLLDHKLEREPGLVWDRLCAVVGELGMVGLLPLVRRAHEEGLCDPTYETLERTERIARKGGNSAWREPCYLIEDAIFEMKDWCCFAKPGSRPKKPVKPDSHEPIVREGRSVPPPRPTGSPARAVPVAGRNDPCPCGSGKKFKKCCGA